MIRFVRTQRVGQLGRVQRVFWPWQSCRISRELLGAVDLPHARISSPSLREATCRFPGYTSSLTHLRFCRQAGGWTPPQGSSYAD